MTIRRSVIADNFPITGHAQGIYMNEVSGILIEENVIDHNGWNNPDRSDATIFNHNIYISADNEGLVVRRNIIANASSHGLQARPGGIIQDNVFVANPIGMSFGLVNGANVTPGGVTGEVSGNVFLEATDINEVTKRGWALEVSNIRPGAGAVIKDNIFAHDQSEGLFAAIQLAVPSGASNPQDGVGIHDLLIENNTIYKFESALTFSNRLVPGLRASPDSGGLRSRTTSSRRPARGAVPAHALPRVQRGAGVVVGQRLLRDAGHRHVVPARRGHD